MGGMTDTMDTCLSKLQGIVKGREAWSAAIHEVTNSWTLLIVVERPHAHSLGVLVKGVGASVGLTAPKRVPALIVRPLGGVSLAPVVAANTEAQGQDLA